MTIYFSPAKINLYLKILSKREDGYHSLNTLMQTISLGDYLHIEIDDHDSLTCSNHNLPVDSSNLIFKALQLFRNKTGFKQNFKVHLEKHIPTQAGLGGGSSNAATMLWACNQLTGLKFSTQQLQEWSSKIGSDIPFFFSQGTAQCTGRGELVKNLPIHIEKKVWIIKPKISLSTPLVFENFIVSENTSTNNVDWGINDLEKSAFKLEPSLLNLKNNLVNQGFELVTMSGSGSSFYCFGSNHPPENLDSLIYSANFINRQKENWYI